MKNNIIALLTVSVLASCGGSGTGGTDTVTVDADFAALAASARLTFDEYDRFEKEGFTPFEAVGAAALDDVDGVTTYAGHAIIRETRNGTLYGAIGSFTATANFTALNVSGTAGGFADTAGRVPGSFTFDTKIEDDGGPARLRGTWAGELTWSDSSILTLNDAPLGGSFVGADLDALDMNSFFSSSGGSGTLDVVGLRQP